MKSPCFSLVTSMKIPMGCSIFLGETPDIGLGSDSCMWCVNLLRFLVTTDVSSGVFLCEDDGQWEFNIEIYEKLGNIHQTYMCIYE